jgi:tripartite-type tricarboxylate transporter receptor subunit TctC
MKGMGRLLLAAAAFAVACAVQAQAGDYPNKAVRFVIPFPPGGPADVIGRMIGEKLNRVWGHPVIVENRPGAGGNVASEFTARAPADGYTLLLAANSHVTNGALYSNIKYDVIKDFTAITQVAYYSLILVAHPSVTARNLKDLVTFAKANPGKLTFSSAGSGTPTHLANELFRRAAGIDIIHVPYKGAAPATTDLLGGQVQLMFNNPLSALPHVKTGKLHAIATTGLDRSPTTPDVPTVAELGYPQFEVGTWFAFLGPAGISRDIVAKVASDIAAASTAYDIRERLLGQGIEARGTTPEQLAAIMRAEYDKWSKVIREANIKPD